MVEYPRWLSRVLRAVGLIGDGDTGDLTETGDLRDRDGRAAVVEMLRASLGLTARDASMLVD